jgi:hypothetical protein
MGNLLAKFGDSIVNLLILKIKNKEANFLQNHKINNESFTK